MKTIFITCCLACTFLFTPLPAYSWGVATHAYYARELAKKFEFDTSEMIYGSMLPDFFNLEFNSDYTDYIGDQTHHEFTKMINAAVTRRERSFAYGFASHNETWGADYTAHDNSRTTPGKGYVVAKVQTLTPVLTTQITNLIAGFGLPSFVTQPLVKELTPALGELFVEASVDMLIKRSQDTEIGYDLLTAAQFEDFEVDSLLVHAYAEDFAKAFTLSGGQARNILSQTEIKYRQMIKNYGNILTKPESIAVGLLADWAAAIAKAKLEAKLGVSVPMPAQTNAVFTSILVDNVIPQVAGDYAAELNATLAYLENSMLPVSAEAGTPAALRLSAAPNPFNPCTVITFQMSMADRVCIKIYNLNGQLVHTLLDGFREQGSHSIKWNAAGFASGPYIVVMNTNSFVNTRKITLLI